MKTNMHDAKTSDGFALLLTLVVVSVILAIGISLLQVTVKQLTLSSVARESTTAIFAANTGMECLQYHRSVPATLASFLAGDDPAPSIECGDELPDSSEVTTIMADTIFKYTYQFNIDYGTSRTTDDTCVDVSMFLTDLSDSNEDIEDEEITGESLATLNCTAGTICTVIFSRGYNRPCSQLDSIFTVQRELTITY